MRAGGVVALAAAAVTAGAAIWTVLPGPNVPLLVAAVAAPEIAPYGLAVALGATLLAARAARGRARTAALALAVLADACFAWPVVAAPFAWANANRALAAAAIPPLRAHRPGAFDETRDVRVTLRAGGALALDFYRPRGASDTSRDARGVAPVAGGLPLVVLIYGGDWQFGSRPNIAPLARWYAARGYAVAAVDYRHAPGSRFSAQLDDVEDALRAIAGHARAWGVDPARVVLFGRSAGAQLALLAAQRPQPLGVRAVVGYYAPTDLTGGYAEPPRPDPKHVRSILEAYLGGPPDALRAARYAAASPLTNAGATPPVLLIGGSRDEVVLPAFGRRFAARLHAQGKRAVLVELPWSNHAFDEVDGLGAALARSATLRFLDAMLAR